MNVQEFKNALKGGGARANLFEVEMGFPSVAGGATETRLGRFLIKAAQIPASTLGIIDVPYKGRILKVAGDRIFVEWNVTVLNDIDFAFRDAFERWSNAINGNESNLGPDNTENLLATASIYQLNRGGQKVKTYVMKDLWPSEIAPIELSSDSTNQIEEFTVTLQYSEWFSNTTS